MYKKRFEQFYLNVIHVVNLNVYVNLIKMKKKTMVRRLFFVAVLLGMASLVQAQYSYHDQYLISEKQDTVETAPENWFNLDYATDKVRGVSTEKAYNELLKDKKSSTVIVAIIDSGIDIEHEDLKDNIWVNSKEVAGNGVDDDKNGYVDDINGWNFIGNEKGEMINQDNLEMTRLYVKYKKQFEGKTATDFKGKKRKEYDYYKKVKKEFEKKEQEAKQMTTMLEQFVTAFNSADSIVKATLGKEEYTKEELDAIESDDPEIAKAKQIFAQLAMMGATPEDLLDGYDYYKEQLEYNLNTEFEPRALVGDDYENKKERTYGNNKVEGPDAVHGTHVAGIVAATRNNEIGMDGVADNVKIMVLRTVPNGDERDKDVANSIYYAVDNGAKIINMSFGKSFSPYKAIVDKAVKYAEKKGVLLVHAAGNDGKNIDEEDNFPTPTYLKKGKKCKTWIEVGASSWENKDEFLANFSNYGERTVSVFAPGVKIYSTVPDNKYKNLQGTSMAAPVVTGVAALVWSYFPELSAVELKDILLKSAVKYSDVKVNVPGTRGQTKAFKNLCSTAGVINAYEAVKMAMEVKK